MYMEYGGSGDEKVLRIIMQIFTLHANNRIDGKYENLTLKHLIRRINIDEMFASNEFTTMQQRPMHVS